MKTIKHDHLLTKLLKVFIFSLMMLLPFMIWLPNGFYYGFNETAEAQTRTEQEAVYYESNEVNVLNDIQLGNVYSYLNDLSPLVINSDITLMNITIKNGVFTGKTGLLLIRAYNGELSFIYNQEGTTYYESVIHNTFDFLVNSYREKFNQMPNAVLDKISICDKLYSTGETSPVVYTMSITESMSYAWQSVWNNSLMSWTNNSILKTPIDNFIAVFAINNDACIGNYLIYILTLTGIYVVIDIVLELFIALTHMFSRETK